MALEIQMSKDIREYKPRVMGPFNRRQAICFFIAAGYGIPLMLAIPVPIAARVITGMAAMIPVLLCGWISVYGIPLEKFFFSYIIPGMLDGARKYVARNSLSYLNERVTVEKVKRTRKYRGLK